MIVGKFKTPFHHNKFVNTRRVARCHGASPFPKGLEILESGAPRGPLPARRDVGLREIATDEKQWLAGVLGERVGKAVSVVEPPGEYSLDIPALISLCHFAFSPREASRIV